jgi:hypothetical protein
LLTSEQQGASLFAGGNSSSKTALKIVIKVPFHLFEVLLSMVV